MAPCKLLLPPRKEYNFPKYPRTAMHFFYNSYWIKVTLLDPQTHHLAVDAPGSLPGMDPPVGSIRELPNTRSVAAVAEWYRHRIVAGFVTSSSPVPLKTRRVGQRCTLNLSRAETSSRWCGVVVRRGWCQLRCRPRHLTMVQNYVVRRQKPSCS
ncbi:uncharacterized protein TNCV_2031071 [Trichonephila clavipes]|nr:uncharacterized protein TNCV_2031071 [Trichonephila clavipes]